MLILATQYAGRELELSLGVKLGLLAFAFLLSVASYRFVENPIRRMKATLRVGGLLWPATPTAVALVAVVIVDSTGRTAARLEAAAAAVHPAQLVRASKPAKTQSLDVVVAAVRQAGRPAALAGHALAEQSPRRLLHAPRRLLARRGEDVEQGLPPRRRTQLEDDRRDRRFARADVDAAGPANGGPRRVGGRPLRQAALHSPLLELEGRVREVVPLGDAARRLRSALM